MPVLFARAPNAITQGLMAYTAGRGQAKQRQRELQAAYDERRNAQIVASLQHFGDQAFRYVANKNTREDNQAHDLTRMAEAFKYREQGAESDATRQATRDQRLQDFRLESGEVNQGYNVKNAATLQGYRQATAGELADRQDARATNRIDDLYSARGIERRDAMQEEVALRNKDSFDLSMTGVPLDVHQMIERTPYGGGWVDTLEGVGMPGAATGELMEESLATMARQAKVQKAEERHREWLGELWEDDHQDPRYQEELAGIAESQAYLDDEELKSTLDTSGSGKHLSPEEIQQGREKLEYKKAVTFPGRRLKQPPPQTSVELYHQIHGNQPDPQTGEMPEIDPWLELEMTPGKYGNELKVTNPAKTTWYEKLKKGDLRGDAIARGEKPDSAWERADFYSKAADPNNPAQLKAAGQMKLDWEANNPGRAFRDGPGQDIARPDGAASKEAKRTHRDYTDAFNDFLEVGDSVPLSTIITPEDAQQYIAIMIAEVDDDVTRLAPEQLDFMEALKRVAGP